MRSVKSGLSSFTCCEERASKGSDKGAIRSDWVDGPVVVLALLDGGRFRKHERESQSQARSPHLPCGNTTGWLLPQVVMATTILMCVATASQPVLPLQPCVSTTRAISQVPCRLFSSLCG